MREVLQKLKLLKIHAAKAVEAYKKKRVESYKEEIEVCCKVCCDQN